jgi:hypothetical protein
MKTSILIVSIFALSFAKIPELRDTTIAVFPNINPGNSLRFHEISYDGIIEKLECYAIGKTVFCLKNHPDSIPEFDSASILVSNKLENLNDENYMTLLKYFPSSIIADTGNIIQTNAGKIETYYYQINGLAIIFSFCNSRAGERHEDLTADPIIFIYNIFDKLRNNSPLLTTATISKIAPLVPKAIKTVSVAYLLNGRKAPPSYLMRRNGLRSNLIILK